MPETTIASIFSTAIPSGEELENVVGIIGQPPHMGRSIVKMGTTYRADDTKDRLYRQLGDKYRIPYDCQVKGVRLAGNQDLSLATLGTVEVVVFDGTSTLAASTIRDRSESIAASRLVSNGGYYYLLFTSPITAQRGDQMGLYLGETGASNETFGVISFVALSSKASGTDGVTAASGVFTSASATFQTDGVAAGYQLVLHTLGASDTRDRYVIDSVDSETQLTITGTFPTNTTGFYYEVSRFQADEGLQLLRSSGDLSGDGPHDMSTNFDLQHDSAVLDICPILDVAPSVAMVGNSIFAGNDTALGRYGGMQTWPNATTTWDLDYDLGKLVEDASSRLGVSLGVAGKDAEDWVDGPPWRITGGGDSEELEVLQQFRASTVVYSSLANDCKKTWNEATYTGYLDDLKAATDAMGSALILTTGTPLPGRSAGEIAKAQDMRDWLATWAASNGVSVIDTELGMRDTTEDTLPAEYDAGDGVHLSKAGTEKLAELIAAGLNYNPGQRVHYGKLSGVIGQPLRGRLG